MKKSKETYASDLKYGSDEPRLEIQKYRNAFYHLAFVSKLPRETIEEIRQKFDITGIPELPLECFQEDDWTIEMNQEDERPCDGCKAANKHLMCLTDMEDYHDGNYCLKCYYRMNPHKF